MRQRQLVGILTHLLTLIRAAAVVKLKKRRPKKNHSFDGGLVVLSVKPKPWETITSVSFKLKPPDHRGAISWIDGSPNLKGNKKWELRSNLTSNSPGTWKWKVKAENSDGEEISKWLNFRVTAPPTGHPTNLPTIVPTSSPSTSPTPAPTDKPTNRPTIGSTSSPSTSPTPAPTAHPTNLPTIVPTSSPSTSPTPAPTNQPTNLPTAEPTSSPSTSPTPAPTNSPSINPSHTTPSPVNDHMRNIFKFFISYRDPRNGMWCDNLAFANSGVCGDSGSWTYDFYSAASTGWGMISDVIFTELGLLTYEEGRARVNETMTNSFQLWPKDSRYGFFKHFSNSAYTSNSEYSTIDTSILIIGSEFAGNYFGEEMRTLADQMFQNVNFQAAIDPDLNPKMYATVGETGMSGRFVAPYNEYYILAYLAQRWEGMYNTDTSHARTYFDTYFGLTRKPVGRKGKPKDVVYKGFEVLSDQGGFVASFIPQFCWYTTQAFRNNAYYAQMMENWLQAERAYWADLDDRRYDTMYSWGKNVTGKVFGSAAGDCPQSAYCVSQVGNTQSNDDTWSAAIMAGFLGSIHGSLRDQINQDIDWLYENDVCTYVKTYKDGSTSKVLWRCSVHPSYSNWQANRPTSVDFGTMVFGYATNFLQPEFWDMYSI